MSRTLLRSVIAGVLAIAGYEPTSAQPADLACPPAWRVVASPNRGQGQNALSKLAVVSATDVWAVGNVANGANRKTLAQHWDGTSWTLVPSPNSPDPINWLIGVSAIGSSDVWAAGFSSTASQNGQSFTLIEHWNGSSWTRVPSPNASLPGPFPPSNELYDVAAVSASDAWAVGHTYDFSDGHTLVMHWNGSTWSLVPSPDPGGYGVLYGVEAVAASDVWAVGTHYENGVQVSLVEHWDGTSWKVVPSPNVGPFHNTFLDLSATSPNDIWAVGFHQTVVGVDQPYQTSVLHWDGSAWSVVPSPDVNLLNNYLYSVASVSATDAWAVGFFDTGTALMTMIQHWDGGSWTIVPSPNTSSFINELFGVARSPSGAVWAVGDAFDGFSYRTLVARQSCPRND